MTQHFEIRPNTRPAAGEPPYDLVVRYTADAPQAWARGVDDSDLLALYQVIHEHFVGRIRAGGTANGAWSTPPGTTVRGPRPVSPCPCECNRGQFCGGCGHAGCGGRR